MTYWWVDCDILNDEQLIFIIHNNLISIQYICQRQTDYVIIYLYNIMELIIYTNNLMYINVYFYRYFAFLIIMVKGI